MTIPQTVHYKAYRPPPLGAGDRGDVTLLFGGLTWKHEQLMQVALESLGYRCAPLPNIGKADLDCGKALIDAGACCPTAFTAGNLARHLRERVASEGREQVLRRYAFVTAGSCGPCRFGQYHESYAMALAGIGLEPLRMFLLDQYHLESQGQDGSAIDVNLPFTLAAVWALMIGDLLTDLEYMTRPYETLPGATATVLRQSVERMARALCEAPPQRGRWRTVAWYLASRHHTRALAEVRALWSGIEVDRLRVRPKVKITGEFWLQTHEGEGNHDIKRWLEREGAEVVPPPVTVWLDYVLAWFERSLDERRHKVDRYAMRKTLLVALRRWLRREYDRLRHALGDLPRELPRQEELAQLAAPFFHPGLEGGEGYMLIGKALHALRHRSAHMVCELSPYGCLPNTMSIGAMAQVLGRHPELLYAPIEIKGDAEVHALSRCQMVLAEARIRAQEEFDQALHASAMNMAQLRAVEAAHPASMRADYRIAPRGRAGTGANYALQLATLLPPSAGRRRAAASACPVHVE